MATYKEIRGTHIVSVTSDPPSPVNGQMWYNSTERVVKGFTSNPAGSWATGGALNTAARRGWGFGQKDSALAFGGYSGGATDRTEQYNGTSWTEVNDLNTARWDLSGMGYGDNTAGLAIGGQPGTGIVALNESWNGSSWTETTNVNTGRANAMGAGTQTSGLFFGGITNNPTDVTADNEYWNGSSWTELNNLNTGRQLAGGSGINYTAALAFGGESPGTAYLTSTESFNGSTWTEVNDLNTGREALSGNGTLTSALASGGHDGSIKAQTESWNGTSWSEDTDLSTGRQRMQNRAGSNNTSALLSGGDSGPGTALTNTEEWTAPTTNTVTFTTS